MTGEGPRGVFNRPNRKPRPPYCRAKRRRVRAIFDPSLDLGSFMAGRNSPETLPTLDIRRFKSDRENFLADLRAAARGPGFFYLEGHGVDQQLIDEVLQLSRRFFALPEKDKLSVEMVNSPHFRGYNRAGYEHTRGKPDWREQLDVASERDPLPITTTSPPWSRLQGPNQWPDALPELKPTLLRYQADVTALAIRVLRAFAAFAASAGKRYSSRFTRPTPNQLIKLIRYPGRIGGRGRPRGWRTQELGVRQHSLAGQGRRAAGRRRRGLDRCPAQARNLCRQYRRNPRTRVQRLSARQCSPCRFAPARRRATLGGLFPWRESKQPCRSLEIAAGARPSKARGLTQDPLNPLFREVGKNFLKSRLRSHPDVAQRHYPDLLDPTQKPREPASAY